MYVLNNCDENLNKWIFFVLIFHKCGLVLASLFEQLIVFNLLGIVF